MSKKNPFLNVDRMRKSDGTDEVIPAGSFDQFEPITSYKLGNSVMVVDMSSIDWPNPGIGTVTTSRADDNNAVQYFQPKGSTSTWTRSWDDTTPNLSDYFTGPSVDLAKWSYGNQTNGATPTISNDTLRLAALGGAEGYSSLDSKFAFAGDYDVQIKITSIPADSYSEAAVCMGPLSSLGTIANPGGNYDYIHIRSSHIGLAYAYINGAYSSPNITGFTGNNRYFRMTRTGTTGNMYYGYSPTGSWNLLKTYTMGTEDRFFHAEYHSNLAQESFWDNFVINSGTPYLMAGGSSIWQPWIENKSAEDITTESQTLADSAIAQHVINVSHAHVDVSGKEDVGVAATLIAAIPAVDLSGKEDVGIAQGIVDNHEIAYDHTLMGGVDTEEWYSGTGNPTVIVSEMVEPPNYQTGSGIGSSNATFRCNIPASKMLANTSGKGLRFAFKCPYSQPTTGVNRVFFGKRNMLGGPVEFAETPVQLFFGGNPELIVPAYNVITYSDEVVMDVDATTDYIISYEIGTMNYAIGRWNDAAFKLYSAGVGLGDVLLDTGFGLYGNVCMGVMKIDIMPTDFAKEDDYYLDTSSGAVYKKGINPSEWATQDIAVANHTHDLSGKEDVGVAQTLIDAIPAVDLSSKEDVGVAQTLIDAIPGNDIYYRDIAPTGNVEVGTLAQNANFSPSTGQRLKSFVAASRFTSDPVDGKLLITLKAGPTGPVNLDHVGIGCPSNIISKSYSINQALTTVDYLTAGGSTNIYIPTGEELTLDPFDFPENIAVNGLVLAMHISGPTNFVTTTTGDQPYTYGWYGDVWLATDNSSDINYGTMIIGLARVQRAGEIFGETDDLLIADDTKNIYKKVGVDWVEVGTMTDTPTDISGKEDVGVAQALIDALPSSTPSFRGCHLRPTTFQNMTTSALPIIFQSEVYDTDNFHDTSVTNTRITIPAGISYVEFTAQARWGTGTTGYRTIEIRKNGAADEALPKTHGAGVAYMIQNISSGPVPVSEGDYFELFGTTTLIDLTNAGSTWFKMKVIG